MMGFYYGSPMAGWMWLTGLLATILFWGGFAALIVWAVRVFARREGGRESADGILRRRLAAGEISQEEYETTRRVLQG